MRDNTRLFNWAWLFSAWRRRRPEPDFDCGMQMRGPAQAAGPCRDQQEPPPPWVLCPLQEWKGPAIYKGKMVDGSRSGAIGGSDADPLRPISLVSPLLYIYSVFAKRELPENAVFAKRKAPEDRAIRKDGFFNACGAPRRGEGNPMLPEVCPFWGEKILKKSEK